MAFHSNIISMKIDGLIISLGFLVCSGLRNKVYLPFRFDYSTSHIFIILSIALMFNHINNAKKYVTNTIKVIHLINFFIHSKYLPIIYHLFNYVFTELISGKISSFNMALYSMIDFIYVGRMSPLIE